MGSSQTGKRSNETHTNCEGGFEAQLLPGLRRAAIITISAAGTSTECSTSQEHYRYHGDISDMKTCHASTMTYLESKAFKVKLEVGNLANLVQVSPASNLCQGQALSV
ncbi:hypothetical protein Pmani_036612 [Petrolisthes manimaculis]|uniref:Uncharacterized protein n=1 Tax=Petrolisthes manimaculis TaxID=1843537 RepID=A0AAE1NK31_9EUCA|nr:hypothetical protein Pmani_036612 [Petrolisthes manimaculis]